MWSSEFGVTNPSVRLPQGDNVMVFNGVSFEPKLFSMVNERVVEKVEFTIDLAANYLSKDLNRKLTIRFNRKYHRNDKTITDSELKQMKEFVKSIAPISGRDYFTKGEIKTFLNAVTPVKGKHYFTTREINKYLKQKLNSLKKRKKKAF